VIGSKHSQNLHHGGQQSSKNGATRKRTVREGRSRSTDWPYVPNVDKIQENNPEKLAQKILETGRQIEAGRIPSKQNSNSNSRTRLPQASLSFSTSSSISSTQTTNKDIPNRTQEPPRVANFEDRLKSIITSVLNEDQQNRNKQQQMQLQSQSESERKRVSLSQNVSTPDYTQVSIPILEHIPWVLNLKRACDILSFYRFYRFLSFFRFHPQR